MGLPAGLNLSSACVLFGTPTTPGQSVNVYLDVSNYVVRSLALPTRDAIASQAHMHACPDERCTRSSHTSGRASSMSPSLPPRARLQARLRARFRRAHFSQARRLPARLRARCLLSLRPPALRRARLLSARRLLSLRPLALRRAHLLPARRPASRWRPSGRTKARSWICRSGRVGRISM